MKKSANTQWDVLTLAALDARDCYRRIHLLAGKAKADPALLDQIEELAALQGNRLRRALKCPSTLVGRQR